ncbi:MAG: MFS transporter [Candidatus Heimdallarchaeota archaeon]|nr:MAG: MFS transporter [Candidatus Heimdallarchaeota archaeon]
MDKNVSSSTRVFFGLSSFQILAMFRRGLFYSYLSIYLRYFLGMSVTETTLFATIPMVLNVSFQTLVWGVLSDKYQLRRTFVILGEILAGIGTIIVFFTHRIVDQLNLAGWIIIIGLSIVEIFWSMSNNGWSALISDLIPYEERSAIQGRLSSMGGLGRIIGVWIGGLLYDGLHLQYEGWGFYEGSLFFVAASVMFLSTIPMVFVPEGGVHRESENELEQQSYIGDVTTPSTQIFIIFLVAITFINFGRNSIATILPQYLFIPSPGFGVSSELLSYILNTQSLAIILLGLIVGRMGHKLGNGNTILLGALMSIISLVLFAISTDLIFIFIASFLRGSAQVIVMASAYAFASGLITPKERAKLFGLFNASFFLSWGLAGTIIAGPITDYLLISGVTEVLAYRTAFLTATFVTFIGAFLLIFLLIWIRPKST